LGVQDKPYYLPQVGDELIYFVSGHKAYLKDFPDNSIGGKIDRKGLIKRKFQSDWVACRVLSIDFEFPFNADDQRNDNGLLCVIQLGTLADGANEAIDNKSRRFFVNYRPGHVLGEFLVPRHVIQQTISRTLNIGKKYDVLYEDGVRYAGVLESYARDEDNMPIWSGALIQWDTGGQDKLNEWELEVHVRGHAESPPADSNVTLVELARAKINERLLRIITEIVEASKFDEFVDEVTEEECPGYGESVPLQITLSIMQARAARNVYRQPSSVLGDARTIFLSCQLYHGICEAITLKAAHLYRHIARVLSLEFTDTDLSDYLIFDKDLGTHAAGACTPRRVEAFTSSPLSALLSLNAQA